MDARLSSLEGQPSTSTADEEKKEIDPQAEFELLLAFERFLSGSKYGKTAEILRKEMEEKGVVPSRTDFTGQDHKQTYGQYLDSLSQLPSSSHVTSDSLKDMMARLSIVSDKEVPPPVKGLKLRIVTNIRSALQRTDAVLKPVCRPHLYQSRRGYFTDDKKQHSPLVLLRARELGAVLPRTTVPGPRSHELIERHFRTLIHLAPIFCVAFDRTESFLITGADDNLVKVFSIERAILRYSYRGHKAEIADLSVSYCNQLVASGSVDKSVRVWRLQNGETMAVLRLHTASITAVRFLPYTANGKMRYLVTTGNDCVVNFYSFNEETCEFPATAPGPNGPGVRGLVYRQNERDIPGAKMIQICHSPGGHVVVIGETHGVIRVYRMHGTGAVQKMADIEAHTDRVDSLEWSHDGLKFCSGSSDGNAKIWQFKYGEWQQKLLAISQEELYAICGANATVNNPNRKNRYKVQMVSWTLDDAHVVTTANDRSFRVWDANTATQLRKLNGHTDDAYLLSPHPIYSNIILSAAHDGNVIFWDVVRGVVAHKWCNTLDGEVSSVYDLAITSNGARFAIVDNKGFVSIYGIGTYKNKFLKNQFYDTDYSPILLDRNGFGIDERTHLACHLMPPPRLVDMALGMAPHEYQVMVPGRERDGEVDDSMMECPWLTREIVPALDEAQREIWSVRMALIAQAECEIYTEELKKERPSLPEPIVPFNQKGRSSRPTSFAAMIQADMQREAHRRRALEAQQLADSRRNFILRGMGLDPEEQMRMDIEAQDMNNGEDAMRVIPEEEIDEYTTDSSDTDYDVGDMREMRRRPVPSAFRGQYARRTVPRMPARQESEQELEEEEEPEIAYDRETRRRRRRAEDDEFGNDLSIDMHDVPSTSTGRRRGRREGTQESEEILERPERSNGRSRRAPRRAERSEEEEVEEEGMEMEGQEEERPVREERRTVRRQPSATEAWRLSFPEWMRAVEKKRFPYVAQIGDHVVYFKQGHENYIRAVETANLYPVQHKMHPSEFIEMEEFAIVEDVKYILQPFRLTQIKLARTFEDGRRTGGPTWTVKYHDMDNVPDFIILRAFYDEGLAMGLDVSDEIEAAIDDKWWSGTVERINRNTTYQDAHWISVDVRWDTGDDDSLSLWDMRRNETGRRSGQPVTDDEVITLGTIPYEEGDWPEGDESGEVTRRRIKRALQALEGCETVGVFAKPVSLEGFPEYAASIAYPMDLQTIKERIDNEYYRRLRSLLQDIRYIALNAEAFNERGSVIVRNAKVLVEAVVKFVNDPSIEDSAIVGLYDSCFDIPEHDLQEYRRRPKPEVNSEMLALLQDGTNGEEGGAPTPGWITDSIDVLEDLMQQTWARRFVIKDETNEALAAVWEQCDDLQTLCDKVRDGGMSEPGEIANEMHAFVSMAKNIIDDRRSEDYNHLVTLQNHFNTKFRPVLTRFENMRASVSSQLGVSLERRMRRRTARVAEPHHAYNTRRSEHAALEAAAAAEEEDYDQPTSSTRSAARHQRGFYAAMANGGEGRGRGGSQETDVSSSSSRRVTGRRTTRSGGRREEEERVPPRRTRDTRTRRVLIETEDEEEVEEPTRVVVANSDEEETEVNGVEEEGEEEQEVEDQNGEASEEEEGEEEEEDDDEDYEEHPTGRASRSKKRAVSTEEDEDGAASTSTASSTRRSTRTKKRARMSSDEEEETMEVTRRGRREMRSTRSSNRNTRPTYDERSDEDDDEMIPSTSVSSRGRVRRSRVPI